MLLEELQKKHDHFVSRVAAMITAQVEYFEGRKRGYNEPHKLAKAKALEAEVKKLVKAENEERKTKQAQLF